MLGMLYVPGDVPNALAPALAIALLAILKLGCFGPVLSYGADNVELGVLT